MIAGETKDLRELVSSVDGAAFTISAPSIKIYDNTGALIASGTPDVDATNPAAQVLSWPFTPAAAGFFIAEFVCSVADETRRFAQTVTVDPLIARFSYDPTALVQGTGTDPGRLALTRLLLTDTTDTDDDPAIYTDAEIRAFLALAGNDCYEAAAQGYETWAATRSRAPLSTTREGFKTQRHAIQHLLQMAQRMRDRALRGQLATGSIDVGTPGELLDTYRREWTDFSDLPEAR